MTASNNVLFLVTYNNTNYVSLIYYCLVEVCIAPINTIEPVETGIWFKGRLKTFIKLLINIKHMIKLIAPV